MGRYIAIVEFNDNINKQETGRLRLIDKKRDNHMYFVFTRYFNQMEATKKIIEILKLYELDSVIYHDNFMNTSIIREILSNEFPNVNHMQYATGIKVKEITNITKIGDDVQVNHQPEQNQSATFNITAPFTGTSSFASQLNINIGFKLMNPDAPTPVYNKQGDSGFDFVAMEDTIIHPGATALIPIGLAFELPLGLEIQIRPRSGISSKTKARVTLGTDDSNYRGELKVNIDNITLPTYVVDKETLDIGFKMVTEAKTLTNEFVPVGTPVPEGSIFIRKGERIAQGVIAYVYKGNFFKKDVLSETDRGETGFGHSGI